MYTARRCPPLVFHLGPSYSGSCATVVILVLSALGAPKEPVYFGHDWGFLERLTSRRASVPLDSRIELLRRGITPWQDALVSDALQRMHSTYHITSIRNPEPNLLCSPVPGRTHISKSVSTVRYCVAQAESTARTVGISPYVIIAGTSGFRVNQ